MDVVESVPWIPQLDLTLDTRLDPLSWLMTLIVGGVGALVLLYCVRYFTRDEAALGRFAAFLTAFAGSMYGLVVADDVYLLFIFWELTTVFSYLLIGHYTRRRASRASALQALLVTTLGGLAMLVGLVLLSQQAGTSNLSGLIAAAPSGPIATTAVALVLVGAITKSAILPFHFWLPGAMAAPTPVSAYLHAAAMVKAGIYLVARLAPGFADTPGWRETLVILGVVTMLVGGWRALRENDLKLVLAYGTVGQLGFLITIVGFGTRDAALAGLALLLAHALFKSTLFLVVGIIDHDAGTRDLRRLSGLGRRSPILAGVAVLAALSMAGLPPTFGFVAKEAVLTAFLDSGLEGAIWGWVALVGVGLGSILTVAYTARFVWGAFARKPGMADTEVGRAEPGFLASPLILAMFGLLLGPLASLVDGVLAPAATGLPAAVGEREIVDSGSHLALWHGFEPALGLSAVTLAAGIGLFLARDAVARLQQALTVEFSAAAGYRHTLHAVDRSAARTTAFIQRGSLPSYLAIILLVLLGTAGTALALVRDWPSAVLPYDSFTQVVVGHGDVRGRDRRDGRDQALPGRRARRRHRLRDGGAVRPAGRARPRTDPGSRRTGHPRRVRARPAASAGTARHPQRQQVPGGTGPARRGRRRTHGGRRGGRAGRPHSGADLTRVPRTRLRPRPRRERRQRHSRRPPRLGHHGRAQRADRRGDRSGEPHLPLQPKRPDARLRTSVGERPRLIPPAPRRR